MWHNRALYGLFVYLTGETNLQVLIHPGFHKTGTTTLQRTVLHNRHVLENRVNFLLPDDLNEVGHLAKRYSMKPNSRTILKMKRALRLCFTRVSEHSDTPVLVSCEAFSGQIPGRKSVWAYEQTHQILAAMVDEVKKIYGDSTQVTIWFTTRNTHDWMKSIYWQNLRSNRITDDFTEYQKLLQPGSNLNAVVQKTRQHLGETAKVVSTDILDCHGLLGPLGKALEILGVQKEGVAQIGNKNVQPRNGIDTLLRLNRSDLDDEELSITKRAYLDLTQSRRKRPAPLLCQA